MVIQELEKVVGFFGLEPDDTANEAGIDVERFLACHWVTANEGVLSMNIVRASAIVVVREWYEPRW